MRTLIVSGGRIDTDFALNYLRGERFDRVIGADGGLRFLYDNDIMPTNIVGDFDSASGELVDYFRGCKDIEIREYNPVKDYTDTDIAIGLALELGSDDIVILGGTGSRIDHVLGNIQCLMRPLKEGVSCVILDEHNRIRLIDRDTELERDEQYGDYISLIPLTSEETKVTLTGFKYPLSDHAFSSTAGQSLGVSNEITELKARICVSSGVLVLIESKD